MPTCAPNAVWSRVSPYGLGNRANSAAGCFHTSSKKNEWKVDNHIERRVCRGSKGARSQAHWCFERSFPLTPPSPLGRGRLAGRCVANRTHGIVRVFRRRIAERTAPVGATSELRKTQGAGSLSRRERARVRGNGTQPTETAGRILQAQLNRLSESELAITASEKPVDGRRARGRKRIGVSSVPSPSPRPLPAGEGESPAALSPIRSASTRCSAGCRVPSPSGRGLG